MSTDINDGGPAFPGFSFTEGRGNYRRSSDGEEWECYMPGMTLRDWFAGQALIGLSQQDLSTSATVGIAYDLADAMLKAREVQA